MSNEPLTFNQAVIGITEFIEVAIHTILYVRQVYPPDLFVRRKKYETPVYQSRHPTLNEYISGAVKAIGEEINQGTVEKVVVVIKNKEQVPLERFIFSIENMIEVETFNKSTNVENAMSPNSLVQYFRSFLIKLCMIESSLGQMELGDDVSFAILLELRDKVAPSTSQTKDPPPWIPAETQHTTAGASDKAELQMIRAVNTGVINVSLAVQESAEKLKWERDKLKAQQLPAKNVPESKQEKGVE
ncbi:DNA-binding protein [Coprinopsis marcescibilis]|uniref:DNA-binding protein n=1 Tax=Coprinopsis marcescibilis TaxID=230819 RepID=A0A5C3LCU3_COPMA|nr:DNA-binding protein [Coprinopsis marcescibilis]